MFSLHENKAFTVKKQNEMILGARDEVRAPAAGWRCARRRVPPFKVQLSAYSELVQFRAHARARIACVVIVARASYRSGVTRPPRASPSATRCGNSLRREREPETDERN